MKKLSLFLITIMILAFAAGVYAAEDEQDIQLKRYSGTVYLAGEKMQDSIRDSDRGIPVYQDVPAGRDIGRDVGRDIGYDAGRDIGYDAGYDVGRRGFAGRAAESLPIQEAAPTQPPVKQNWWSNFWGKVFSKHSDARYGQAISVRGRGNVRLIEAKTREELLEIAQNELDNTASGVYVVSVDQDGSEPGLLTRASERSGSSDIVEQCDANIKRCFRDFKLLSRTRNVKEKCKDSEWGVDGGWINAVDLPFACKEQGYFSLANIDSDCAAAGFVASSQVASKCTALNFVPKTSVAAICGGLGFARDVGKIGNEVSANAITGYQIYGGLEVATETDCNVKRNDCLASGYVVKADDMQTTCGQLGFESPASVFAKCKVNGFFPAKELSASCMSKGYVHENNLATACTQQGFVPPVTFETCQAIPGMVFVSEVTIDQPLVLRQVIVLNEAQKRILTDAGKTNEQKAAEVFVSLTAVEKDAIAKADVSLTAAENDANAIAKLTAKIDNNGAVAVATNGLIEVASNQAPATYTANAYTAVDNQAATAYSVNQDITAKNQDLTARSYTVNQDYTVKWDNTGATNAVANVCCQVKIEDPFSNKLTYESKLLSPSDCTVQGVKVLDASFCSAK